MLSFNSLHLKKCVYFGDAKLDLNSGEILVVNGRNLRSREKGQTNGSGKSLFFSYIPNIAFANHPLAIRANAKKEMFSDKNAVATLDYTVGSTNYVVSQKGGHSISYDIRKDGKKLKNRTTPLCEKFIKASIPISEAEFYTLVYLNSQRDFVFQRGKSDARLKFFTEFFRLDYYDQMKAQFQEELRKVKRVEIEVSTYEGQRLRLSEDLKELEDAGQEDLEELLAQQKELKKQKSKLTAKVDELSKIKGFVELRSQLTANIGSKDRPSEKRIEFLNSEIEKLEDEISNRRRHKQLLADLDEANSDYTKSRSKIKKICTELGVSLDDISDFDPGNAIASKYRDLTSNFNTLVTARKNYEKQAEKLRELKAKVNTKYLKADDVESKIADAKQQIRTYNKMKEHIEDNQCPVCGSAVDMSVLKKKAVAAKEVIEELELAQDYHDLRKQVQKLKEDINTDEEESLSARLKKLKPAYEKHERIAEKFSSVTSLIADIKSDKSAISKLESQVEKIAARLNKSLDVKKLDDLREELASSESLNKLFKQLDKLDRRIKDEGVQVKGVALPDIKERLDKVIRKQAKLEGELEDLNSKVNRNTVHVEKEKLLKRKMREVNEKIGELNAIVADRELLENLIKVYSNKGIKIQRVNAICRIIEKNLNHFKALLFDEPFKFKIHITESSFDVIVDRNDGIVSDVRHLSGSESRRFNLLLLISLLPLTPKARRTNLVILDEMESNSSPTTLRLFCERFIPELHKLVPNVIVVTPLDMPIENSKRVLVTKDKDGSRIETIKEMQG